LITGVAGQDGSYLAELLLSKGYEVWGLLRRHSSPEVQTNRLDKIGVFDKVNLVYGDMTDMGSLLRILKLCKPHEIYNLAAQSHVRVSFDQPAFTLASMGALNLYEATSQVCEDVKIYQAGSSEMFGNSEDADGYQRETTRMLPVSPYGCAKLYAHNLGRVYRESYGMYIANGILFNHESPRRGLSFVTNKIVTGAVAIKKGEQEFIHLGNLDATRDWGHAKDYVRAMWMMLQQSSPNDYVCATGESHSVRDFCKIVFSKLDMDYKNHVRRDLKYLRPTELHDLKGDSTKLRKELGWAPEYTFETLVEDMIYDKIDK